MILFSESARFIAWASQVFRVFMRIRPVSTVALVCALVLARVAGVLAFFLPLKVILLAGSDGIPRYFAFFIEPGDKGWWVIVFSIGALLAYGLTLVLDAFARRLIESSSLDVVSGANELVLTAEHQKKAEAYYGDFSRVAAFSVFSLILLAVLAALNLKLILILVAFIAAAYLITAFALAVFQDEEGFWGMAGWINRRLSSYLNILASILFFLGFLVLLLPYLQGLGGNLLIAVLCVVILRQLSGGLTQPFLLASQLSRERHRIDPLVFPEQRLEKRGEPRERILFTHFKGERRSKLLSRLLETLPKKYQLKQDSLRIEWRDPPSPRVCQFDVRGMTAEGSRQFCMQLYMPKDAQGLPHESFLFDHMDVRSLCASPVLSQLSLSGWPVTLRSAGAGEWLSRDDFKKEYPEIAGKVAAVAPPPPLIAAYSKSYPLIHERIGNERMNAVQLACRRPEDERLLDEWWRVLPRLQVILSELPLSVINPGIRPGNIVRTEAGAVRVLDWSRWRLEPMGVGIEAVNSRKKRERFLEAVAESDVDRAKLMDPEKLQLVFWVDRLDQQLNQFAYGQCLTTMERILSAPLLQNSDRDG